MTPASPPGDAAGLPRLDGRVAFVAGASRGIGREIARALAGAGASVVVAARTADNTNSSPNTGDGTGAGTGRRPLPGTIHAVAQRIRHDGGEAWPVRCDVTDEASVEAAVAGAVDRYGGLDIVVCNAGVTWLAPTSATPLRRWDLVLRVNLTGTFLVTRAALPHLQARGRGSLIALTTTGVRLVELGANAYWAAKAGVERYYAGLAHELRPHNIAVNCLAPAGVVLTEGWEAAGAGIEVPPEMVEDPSVVASAAVVLAAQDGSGITGGVHLSTDLCAEEGAR